MRSYFGFSLGPGCTVTLLFVLLLVFCLLISRCGPREVSAQEPLETVVCVSPPSKWVRNSDEAIFFQCVSATTGEVTLLMTDKPDVLPFEEARLWSPSSLLQEEERSEELVWPIIIGSALTVTCFLLVPAGVRIVADRGIKRENK